MSQETEKKITTKERSYCCGSDASSEIREKVSEETKVRQTIRNQYANIALGKTTLSEDEESATELETKGTYTEYSEEELSTIPKNANLGLGSGNPISIANLQSGETVVDLGSGAGIDCFLASNKVGESGKVIGIDMTPQMIDKARENALEKNYKNVEFRLGEIEYLPVRDSYADVIVSNCVINLALDKEQVFREAFRILKPGGRLIVSDIIYGNDLPDPVREVFKFGDGCVSRAWLKDDYLNAIRKAGFQSVEIVESQAIKPRNEIKKTENGQFRAKLISSGQTHEILLSEEEAKNLAHSILKAHVRGFKPLK